MPTRMLLVGLDGTNYELVSKWMEDGRMPTLARLRATGTCGTLVSPPGLGDVAAWASFASGLNPGRHGRFHHRQIRPGAYPSQPFRREHMATPPFWDALDAAGRDVAVLDVPHAPLGHPKDAVVLADWMPHGPETHSVVAVDPSVASMIRRDFSPAPGFVCDQLGRSPHQYVEFVEQLLGRLALRTSLTQLTLANREWDVVMAVVAETHCVGHQCWHLHDESHPAHDPAVRAAVGDPLEQMYSAADHQLGSLLESVGPATTVIVFSVLGMGPNYSGKHLLPEILRRLDANRTSPRVASRALRKLAHALPAGIKRRAPAPVRRTSESWREEELAASRFFALDHDFRAGAVRINLAGREPSGRVEPGPEREAVLQYLEEELAKLRDEDTGDAVVADLIDTGVAYPGPRSDSFADLLVEWRPECQVTAVRSPRVGVVRSPMPADRSGNHWAGGWFVASGPGVSRAAGDGAAQIVDLTSSICAATGVELDAADGQLIGRLAGDLG
jgi:predicted AlkP superfamily phosphohydrolase/phosphomutase